MFENVNFAFLYFSLYFFYRCTSYNWLLIVTIDFRWLIICKFSCIYGKFRNAKLHRTYDVHGIQKYIKYPKYRICYDV